MEQRVSDCYTETVNYFELNPFLLSEVVHHCFGLNHVTQLWVERINSDLELEGVAVATQAKVVVPDCAVIDILLGERSCGSKTLVVH